VVRPYQTLVNLVSRLLDVAVVTAALAISALIMDVTWLPSFSMAVLLAVLILFLAAGSADLYNRTWRSVSLSAEFGRVLLAWGWVVIGLLLLAYASKTSAVFSRRTITLWFILAPTLMVSWRIVARLLLMQFRQLEGRAQRVVIVGAGKLGQQLANAIRIHPGSGLRVQAFYDDSLPTGEAPSADPEARVQGNLEQLVDDARQGKFDEVYIALPIHAEARIRQVLAGLADTPIPTYLVPDLFAFTLLHARMSDIAGMPIVSVYGSPHHGMGGIVKRLEDVALTLLILMLILIPMLLIALGVRLSSKGPILFKQRRYGLSGEQVVIWKFRTMNVCEDDDSVTQAQRNDPRVTPFGAFLRRYSLDELPQFINVLQGHMSIVGPRPHAVVHNEEYRKIIPGYMLRHIVKPGITGWAQINGWRGETETLEQMQKRVEFDLEYIRSWSLWLDLKIIILTVFKGLTGSKAY
jgi:putative colanic acid biosynthesis UDP-glucose lipid carrier transferase